MASVKLDQTLISEMVTELKQEEFYDTDFPGPGSFGIRINSGGKKSFFLVYPLNGRRRRIGLGAFPAVSLEDAKQRAQQILQKAAQGDDPAAERRRYGAADDFESLCRQFMTQHAIPNCSAATTAEYKRIIQRELVPVWGKRLPRDISADDAARLLLDVANRRRSPVMANRIRLLISTIFNFGMELGAVMHNPVRKLRPPAAEQPRAFALTLKQAQELWVQLGREDQLLCAAFRLMLLTGQRPGSVLAMRWSNIQLDCWVVPDMPDNHRIYLPPPAQNLLKGLQSKTGRGEFVFAHGRGMRLRYVRKAAARISAEPELGFTFAPSDLRRTFELRIRELGVRPDVIERILGRQSARKQLQPESFDYYPEIQQALTRWSRAVVPTPKRTGPSGPGTAKVIPLFGE